MLHACAELSADMGTAPNENKRVSSPLLLVPWMKLSLAKKKKIYYEM